MTIDELKEEVREAEESVAKAEKTLARHEAQAQKKLNIINKKGWEMDSKKHAQEGNFKAWQAITGYKNKMVDIQSATKKLNEKKRILQKQILQLI